MKKIIKIILISLFILGIFFLLFRGYLWLNFVLGNDVLIKVSANQEDFKLKNGVEEKVIFNIRGVSNPFCKVNCEYNFLDISNNNSIEKGNFSLMPFIEREFILNSSFLGEGQSIYKFSLNCKGIKEGFCNTQGEPTKRTLLITVEHELNDEEKLINEETKIKFYNLTKKQNEINCSIAKFSKFFEENYSLSISNFFSLKNQLSQINKEKLMFLDLWQNQNYTKINESIINLEISTNILEENYSDFVLQFENWKNEKLNQTIEKIFEYQDLACQLSESCLENSKNISFNYNSSLKLLNETNIYFKKINENNFESFINSNYPLDEDFNQSINSLLEKFLNKETNWSLENNTYLFPALIHFLTERELNYSFDFLEFNYSCLSFGEELNNPEKICCYFKNCSSCLNESEMKKNIPIVFVHGHDFNKNLPSDYSVDGFQEIEETLEREGYLSAGIVSLSSPDNGPVWGISGIPISVRASYYFDVYKTSTTSEIIQAKSENIDTYAIRLRKIIDQVKVKTGSSKVMIIAHSMGGLVSRRYIQLFGNESVEKLILITVPNSGIEGSISISCPIFGAKQECNDMTKGSLFLNNLNYDFSPYVKTYNVIGTGCFSDKKKSDGVVLEKNAYLENANNYYLEGNCSGVEFFHNRILRTNEYPELADLLLEIISN